MFNIVSSYYCIPFLQWYCSDFPLWSDFVWNYICFDYYIKHLHINCCIPWCLHFAFPYLPCMLALLSIFTRSFTIWVCIAMRRFLLYSLMFASSCLVFILYVPSQNKRNKYDNFILIRIEETFHEISFYMDLSYSSFGFVPSVLFYIELYFSFPFTSILS